MRIQPKWTYRTYRENQFVPDEKVKKYHIEVSKDFDRKEMEKVQRHLLQNAVMERCSHYVRRGYQKKIPPILFSQFMEKGKCFEYKLVDGQLYRFAVRYTEKKDRDYIAVFQPQYKLGILQVVMITCYANSKDDKHGTLRKGEYVA